MMHVTALLLSSLITARPVSCIPHPPSTIHEKTAGETEPTCSTNSGGIGVIISELDALIENGKKDKKMCGSVAGTEVILQQMYSPDSTKSSPMITFSNEGHTKIERPCTELYSYVKTARKTCSVGILPYSCGEKTACIAKGSRVEFPGENIVIKFWGVYVQKPVA